MCTQLTPLSVFDIYLLQSRRDDLESLGFMLMYFLRGSLPWQGMRATGKKEKYRKISMKKMSTSADHLCQGFDTEFADYLKYCRSLKFDATPDYEYLKSLFRAVMMRHGWSYDWQFDWCQTIPHQHAQQQQQAANYNTAGNAVAMLSAHQHTATNVATITPAPLSAQQQLAMHYHQQQQQQQSSRGGGGSGGHHQQFIQPQTSGQSYYKQQHNAEIYYTSPAAFSAQLAATQPQQLFAQPYSAQSGLVGGGGVGLNSPAVHHFQYADAGVDGTGGGGGGMQNPTLVPNQYNY